MTESDGWFVGVDFDDDDRLAEQIRTGRSDVSDTNDHDWPSLAVESGVASDEEEYYERLREVTLTATRAAVRERALADDRQIVHAVRAMDDAERVANELAERVSEWAGSRFEDAGAGVRYARSLAEKEPNEHGASATTSVDEQLVSFGARVRDLDDESTSLRRYLERTVPEVAPNLAMLAGPVLAARLIALAGGLETLAKKPSGTVQVLGAEDALFAHLRGRATAPKHGVIYVHEYVSGTAREHRGSAARALAGKLSIAARVDHYSGDRRPELQTALDERIDRIRSRRED
ncbi:NOP5/NOP56 family protein [Halocatena marina]|uniref:NOP5/NOP56 family protein n=1 Tax=Halocatena marina TaxID=2934937 RepID=UPI0022253E6F|nr:NOP5/NOP56 family protein [Halocatena marina]